MSQATTATMGKVAVRPGTLALRLPAGEELIAPLRFMVGETDYHLGHDDLVREWREAVDRTVNQWASEEWLEGLVHAHAGGLSASLDHEAEHEVYYTEL